jgi:hypothetical protein
VRAVAGVTLRTFSADSLRAAPWKPRKKSYSWQALGKSGTLFKSIPVTALTGASVLGGKLTAIAADEINEIVRRKIEGLLK